MMNVYGTQNGFVNFIFPWPGWGRWNMYVGFVCSFLSLFLFYIEYNVQFFVACFTHTLSTPSRRRPRNVGAARGNTKKDGKISVCLRQLFELLPPSASSSPAGLPDLPSSKKKIPSSSPLRTSHRTPASPRSLPLSPSHSLSHTQPHVQNGC